MANVDREQTRDAVEVLLSVLVPEVVTRRLGDDRNLTLGGEVRAVAGEVKEHVVLRCLLQHLRCCFNAALASV